MRLSRILLTVLIFCICLSIPASALTIKLGSLAPEASPWGKALKKLAAEWNSISRGRVNVKIFPGGIAGGEFDMIRKIRINQLQAAAITGIGLGTISTDIVIVQLPFLVKDDDELNYVLEKMRPTFDKIIEEKGFKLLEYTMAGWATIFSKKPVITPEDLKKLKMYAMDGHSELDQAWKAMGYHIIPLPATDVIPALQSGMVETFITTPLMAAAMQWFGLAPHMADLKFGPMTGGIIISRRTWQRIPEEIKPELLAAAERIIKDLYKETREVEEKALEVMLQHGLIINPIPPKAYREWEKLVDTGFSMLIGDVFSREVYDELKGYIEEYRKK
ncbi:hypothetical protein ES703_27774 [subsurface metagenome]